MNTTIVLTRDQPFPERTLGTLIVYLENLGKPYGSNYTCFTCELPRNVDGAAGYLNDPNDTCIPVGTYEVIIDQSVRFKKLMPHVLNVPLRKGIRIHSGNDEHNTLGCVLLGTSRTDEGVWHSRDALAEFMPILVALLKVGKVFLNVRDAVV